MEYGIVIAFMLILVSGTSYIIASDIDTLRADVIKLETELREIRSRVPDQEEE